MTSKKSIQTTLASILVGIFTVFNAGCRTPTPQPKSPGPTQETITKNITHPEHGRIDYLHYLPTKLTFVYVSTPGTSDHQQTYCDLEGDGRVDSVMYSEPRMIDNYYIDSKQDLKRTELEDHCPALFEKADKEFKTLLDILDDK